MRNEHFDHFAEKTDIVSSLAGRKLEALGVAVAVETALYDYNQYLKQPAVAITMQMRKSDLIKVLLQDSPEAIEELKGHGLIE